METTGTDGEFVTVAQVISPVHPDGITATVDAVAVELTANDIAADRVHLGSAVPGTSASVAVLVESTVVAASVLDAQAAAVARLHDAGLFPEAVHTWLVAA